MKLQQVFFQILLGCLPLFAFAQGSVSGTLLDANNGEPLMFANVAIEGTTIGATTDLDGKFQLTAEAGTYNLIASYVGYQDKKVEGLVIKDGENKIMDITLSDQTEELAEVVVTAKALERSENALMMLQKKSDKIQDGISSQEMNRYNLGDAASAMKKVTGATVTGGKYIYIRGLGDRYSLSQLNGLVIPSSDPYRNGAQLDLIPTNLLDNIITAKTYTPDLPGTFTGGNVNIKTKSFPEQYSLTFSVSGGYNTQANGASDFLTHEGGSTDVLGFDDGNRARPALLDDEDVLAVLNTQAPLLSRIGQEEDRKRIANLTDSAIRSVNNNFAPSQTTSPINQSYSISFGNQYNIAGRPLGVIAAASFKRNFQHLPEYERANWFLENTSTGVLRNQGQFAETLSTETPTINGIVGLAYKLSDAHEITFNTIYNHSTDKTSRFIFGERPDNIIAPEFLEGRALSFKQRSLLNFQLGGNHVLTNVNGIRAEWKVSRTVSDLIEPDTRFFENQYNSEFDSYAIPQSNVQRPFHFFRDLQDEQLDAKLDLTIPFTKNSANKIQVGGLLTQKDRTFNEWRYQVEENIGVANTFDGTIDTYLGEDNIGIVGTDDTGTKYFIGNYLVNRTEAKNNYIGAENITAFYGMMTYNLTERFKAIAGARYEITKLTAESEDPNKEVGNVDVQDILPSVNLIYSLNNNMNVRTAFSKTLARPNMREIAPFEAYDPLTKETRFGNPNLERTEILNFDARWEWFPKAGELFAVSGYYKDFTNPISLIYRRAPNPEIQFTNVPSGELYGLEVEFRKNLDFISPALNNFKWSANFSYIQSRLDVEDEFNTGVEPVERPFEGQSPFIINTALVYTDADRGWDAVLSLNVIGDRLNIIGREGTPDLYDRGRAQLDFSLSKKIGAVNLKFTATNLLNQNYVLASDYLDQEYIYYSYTRGITFGFGASYTLR